MSWALMSSRAVTAIFCSLLSRIRWASIERVLVNIGQNGGGQQTADSRDPARTLGECGSKGGRGNRLRRHRYGQDGAGRGLFKRRNVVAVALVPESRKRAVQRIFHARSRARDDGDVRQRGDLAPAMPRRQARERVDAGDENQRALRRLGAQLGERVERVT